MSKTVKFMSANGGKIMMRSNNAEIIQGKIDSIYVLSSMYKYNVYARRAGVNKYKRIELHLIGPATMHIEFFLDNKNQFKELNLRHLHFNDDRSGSFTCKDIQKGVNSTSSIEEQLLSIEQVIAN